MDAATKKLFALVTQLEQKIEKLDDLEKRLGDLDNGKLAEIKKSMAQVAVNSRVVVHEVERHGTILDGLEKVLRKLELRCPLMREDASGIEEEPGEEEPDP